MEVDEVEIESSSGIALLARDCHSPLVHHESKSSLPTIVWVHGLGEHGGRYLHLAKELVGRGWRLILIDLRGHGRSAGTRTHVKSFDEFSEDLARVWTHFHLGSGRAILAAHSMGALVASRTVQLGRLQPSAIVITAPLLKLKVHVNPIKRFVGSLLLKCWPKARFRNGLDPSNMTRDEQFAREREADPMIVRTVTTSWFFAMQSALVEVHRDAEKISTPILALQGDEDETTDGDIVEAWLQKTKSHHRTFVLLKDHLHDLIHESDWKATVDTIVTWIESAGLVTAQLKQERVVP